MILFAIATLAPGAMLIAAALFGGHWPLAALVWITALTAGLDALIARTPDAREGQEFPAADPLSVALALLHFAVLPLVVIAIASGASLTGEPLPLARRIALFFAAGLWFGQVSNSNAHELIHRSRRGLYLLGVWVYISLFYGQHASAHRLVHHRYVGLKEDPNTARRGESFYRFAARAWPAELREGFWAESRLRKGRGWHPYRTYALGSAVMLGLAFWLAGAMGALIWLLLGAYATLQLLLSDYVQHYGLARAQKGDRAAPVSADLSWNSPHWFSSGLMLNAPRHSDHHQHPSRPYPALRLGKEGVQPMLPYSLPIMAAVALYPRLWRKMMHPRLEALQARTSALDEAKG